MATDRDPDARAASGVAKDCYLRAAALEQQAAATREHELRVQAAETKLADWHVHMAGQLDRAFFVACGLGWTEAHDDLLSALVQAIAKGERDGMKMNFTIPQIEADAAREAIDAQLRHRYRAEMQAELDARQEANESPEAPIRRDYDETDLGAGAGASTAPVANPDSKTPTDAAPTDPAPEQDMPTFAELPPAWQQKYRLNPSLGVSEYLAAVKREKRQREERENARRRTRPDYLFQHPGLARTSEGPGRL